MMYMFAVVTVSLCAIVVLWISIYGLLDVAAQRARARASHVGRDPEPPVETLAEVMAKRDVTPEGAFEKLADEMEKRRYYEFEEPRKYFQELRSMVCLLIEAQGYEVYYTEYVPEQQPQQRIRKKHKDKESRSTYPSPTAPPPLRDSRLDV